MKIGDIVSRKKYHQDIIFEVIDIQENICYLRGIEYRLIADSEIDDLELVQEKRVIEDVVLPQEKCLKGRKGYKTVSRDVVLNEFYAEVDKNLSTEQGKEMKKQRSVQVEGAFGVIKQDMKFTRFTRRGLKNTKMEFLLVCIGYNLRKYHNYRIKRKWL